MNTPTLPASPPDADLLRQAETAAANAYAAYSGYFVGAALRSVSGHDYAGCNVENAAFPIGGCAERAALAAAVLAEGAGLRLQCLVVVAHDAAGRPLPVSPCGACRQALAEFGGELEISFRFAEGQWMTRRVSELLPYGFVLPER